MHRPRNTHHPAPSQPVSARLKKQLLWAFDPSGRLDADRFLTILKHEHVKLTDVEALELVSELTSAERRDHKPTISPN